MASFFNLISISLALLSICQADLIDDICSKSKNPSLCVQTLRSDPRSHRPNRQVLGLIAIEKAQAATKASITVAKSVTDGANRKTISTCVESFIDAVDNLNVCKELVKAHDRFSIHTLQNKGTAALMDVVTCSDEFGAREPPQLKQATTKAYQLIQLVLNIAESLYARI